MGCIYSNYEGNCNLYDEDKKDCSPNGCSDDGYCNVESDPTPSDGCESYESDWICDNCGADFNADEECTCEQD